MNRALIRPAVEEDAEALLQIYAPFVLRSPYTFEYAVPTTAVFADRISQYMETYPWLVCEVQGKQVGYAYAGSYRERKAYQWCVETSIYLDDSVRGSGLAAVLYSRLLELLSAQGFLKAYAVITTPNPVSERFHEKCGFIPFATYRNVGYKLGKWHDVLWMEKELGTYTDHPSEPTPWNAWSSGGEHTAIIELPFLSRH